MTQSSLYGDGDALEALAVGGFIVGAIIGGIVAYFVVKAIARRFVEERWAVLIAGIGVSVFSVGYFAVPAVVLLVRDMLRLPPKQ